MAHLSSHVLDASCGRPAAGIDVKLDHRTGAGIARSKTDDDGRVADFGHELDRGMYRLTFDTAAYFTAQGITGFYPEVIITFEITDAASKYHVPLLLSPYAYSTYRGS